MPVLSADAQKLASRMVWQLIMITRQAKYVAYSVGFATKPWGAFRITMTFFGQPPTM
jgi:hypothetical protein